MQERIWLLELDSLNAIDVAETLRFASSSYISPSGFYYDDRLKQPALYTTAAYTGAVIEAGSRSAFGESVLVNADGGLDFLADYALDGRTARLKLIDENAVEVQVILGTIESLAFDNNTVSVRLRDPQEILENNHPNTTYLGNNALPAGTEGTANDLKGKVKPLCYGKVRNATPLQVNSAKLIYQIHDSSISPAVTVGIPVVYDRGVMLTHSMAVASLAALEAAVVPASLYATYQGYFRLGSSPDGEVTCDIDSSTTALGDVFALLAVEAGFTLNASDKTAANAFGDVGLLLQETTRTSDLFDILTTSIGGYWTFSTATEIRLKQLIAPSSPTLSISDYQVTSVNRSSTGAGPNGIPVYAVRMQADKVETVQSDLAAAATAAQKARVQQEYREALYKTAAVLTRHPLAQELQLTSAFRNLADADTQAQRIQTLLGVRRDSVEATVRLDADVASSLSIGTVVNLSTYKLGYSAGRNFILLGYTLDARLSRATLNLWG